MSVLVGAMNKSRLPPAPFKSESSVSELGSGASEAGPSGDGFRVTSSPGEQLLRQFSKSSIYDSEEEGHEEEKVAEGFALGPLMSLKAQLEKDKEDESLRRWKEQLLGASVEFDTIEDGVDPEVHVLSLSIMSAGRPDIVVPLPVSPNSSSKHHLFTLKEGSTYNLKFTFLVRHNIVSGLKYLHTVWKNGIRVDNTRVMLGTFGPQREPYTYVMEEETTPSGLLARGNYTARTKFIDDDRRCYFEIEHTFDIRKDW